MEGFDSHIGGGSLQISSEVIEKVARHAAMEVEGVADVHMPATPKQNLLDKIMPTKPVHVEVNNEVADISVCIVAEYGSKIPELSRKLQENIKNAIQSMTTVTVGRVDIVVTGVAQKQEETPNE